MVGYDPVLAAIAPPLHTHFFLGFFPLSPSCPFHGGVCCVNIPHPDCRNLPNGTKADGFTIVAISRKNSSVDRFSPQDAVTIVCPNPAAKQNVPEIGELGESYGPH